MFKNNLTGASSLLITAAMSWPSSSTSTSSSSEVELDMAVALEEAKHMEPCSSKEVPVETQRKIRNVRKSMQHHCAVCGDRPTGYHYDVLSCNGCKTFFRRTIINGRSFTCSKGGTCQFNKDFRCACRACRFAKCVKAGMNRKAIQFPSRKSDDESPVEEAGSPDLTVVPASSMTIIATEDTKYLNCLDSLLYRENCVQSIRNNKFPIYTEKGLRKILQDPALIGCRLTPDEKYFEQQRVEYETNPVRFWMVADLFLSVEFAKTFKSFQRLGQEDKQVLLSHVGGILQSASQAFYSVQQHSDSLTFPDGLDALQHQLTHRSPKYEQYYRESYGRPVALLRDLNLTKEEWVLFKTLALFSPDASGLTPEGAGIVQAAREKLVTYMRRIMIRDRGMVRGTEKLASTILALATFLTISERRRNYLEVCDLIDRLHLTSLAQGIYLKRFHL